MGYRILGELQSIWHFSASSLPTMPNHPQARPMLTPSVLGWSVRTPLLTSMTGISDRGTAIMTQRFRLPSGKTLRSPVSTCTLEAITHDEDLINAPIKPWPPGTFELGEFVQPVQKTQGFATFFSASCRGQTGPDSRRLFWLVAEVDTSPPFDKSPANATLSQGFNATSDIIVLRSTQKFCRPQYAFQEAFVRVNTSTKVDPTVTRNPGAEQRQSQPLDPFDLVVAMQSLSYGIPLVGVNQINEYKNDYIQFAPDRQSQLALPAVSSQQDLDALFQPEIVENAYYGYFRAFAAQIAAQGVFYPLESIVAGEVSYFEDRLFLRIVAVRTMELLFAVLILTSIMMTGLLSRTLTLPFDPCSIAACGKIIRESAGIQSLLRRMGAASLSIIKERLESFTYLSAPYSPGLEWSVVARSATMELMHDEQLSRTSPVDVSKDRWWCPIITRIESRLLLGFIMLCIVALLELTVQISERNEGLASIRTNSNLHYSWTLFPATVMVILGIACRSLDLTTKICTPFIALKDGSEEKCLNLQLLTQSSGLSVFTAVRARYVPASLTTVTVILASFLTIVVSGVYTPKDVSTASIMQIRPNTWFNGTWDFDLSQNLDFDGVVRSSLVLLGNMSWPALTYETLAFPSIEPLGSDTATLYDSSMISAQLPAVRASLTCKYYQGTDVLMAKVVDVPVANVTYVDIEASMPLPRGCQEQSLFSSQLVVNTPIAPQTAFGHADADVVQPPFLVPDPNPSCPLYAFYWGSIEDREIKHIAALSCTEHLEEVQAIVTFDYPLLTVSSESPPMILDSSTRYFSNTTLVTPFTEGFRVWPAIRTQPENEDPEPLDAFFASLIDSRFGIPQEHLTQLKHDQGVIEAIKFQHGVIRAQQFATVLSINANSSSAYGFGRRTFNATAINPSVSRLVTDKVSSRVLEALLAVMAVCVFVHCYVLDVRKVLPHNPCSIAGMMSLLAGSRHLNELAASGGRESNASARSAAERCARTWRLGWFNGSTDDSEKDAKEATFTIDVEVEGKEREVSSLSTEQPARSMSVHQADEQMAPNQEQPETNADEISRFPSSKAKTLTIGNQQIEEDGIHEETEQ